MEISDIHNAGSCLTELVKRALNGEEVLIARDGKPLVRLVPVSTDLSPRTGGQWQGQVRIADDFDELPPEIAEAFGANAEASQ